MGAGILRIPQMVLRDKQAFRNEGGMLRHIGKPLDEARRLKKEGCQLIHIVDMDTLAGLSNNLDVYSNLTYVINVQVECAPVAALIMKLLTLKCRVVLPPSFDTSHMKEKRLLVAKIPKGYEGDAAGFHDVILEDADEGQARRFTQLGKRIIIYEKDEGKVKEPWGVISSS